MYLTLINSFMLYFRCRTLRTPGNILVANLALSDFLMLTKTPIFIFNSFNLGPALGKTGKSLDSFLNHLYIQILCPYIKARY